MPPNTISALADQIADFLLPSSPSSILSALDSIQHNYITPYILSPLQSLFTAASSSLPPRFSMSTSGMSDLVSLLALIVIAFISFRILDYIRRVVMWWVMLALKLCLLLVVMQVGWYVSQHGLEQTLNDAGWLWGLLEGFLGTTGAQVGAGTKRRMTATGTRVRGRQQTPLANTRDHRRLWT
jgi:hypothetical protein